MRAFAKSLTWATLLTLFFQMTTGDYDADDHDAINYVRLVIDGDDLDDLNKNGDENQEPSKLSGEG